MNLLDYILLALLLICSIRGIFRGLVGELASIIGVFGSFYGAYTYYPHATAFLARWINNPSYQKIAGFILLFICIYIIVAILATLVRYLMNISLLGWTNHAGGAIVGGLKGGLFATILIMILIAFLPSNASLLSKSLITRHLINFSAALALTTPKEMKNVFSAKMKELNQTWKHHDL